MELLNIKEYTKDWKAEMAYEISKMAQAPTLSIYQVGDNEASNRYVRNKLKDCAEVGIRATHKLYDESVTEEELMEDIYYRDNSDGIIVQLPLPPHIDAKRIARAIPVEKDVDGFREGSPFMCCTPGGIIQYLDSCGFRYEGSNAVVIGRSEIVGRPMARYLVDRHCTVTICHSKTSRNYLYTLLNWADLVICAVGKRGVFRSSEVDPKTVVIDVGINFDENGKLCGDVINDIGSANVTPVPGGVGLLTRCQLLANTIQAAKGV